jgi:hypothetical protein
VSFRDDRDAMLARMAALERQAADADELRRRVAALEVENQRLAAELSALRARLEPPPPPPAPPQPAPRPIAFRISGPDGFREVTLALSTIKIGRLSSAHLRLDDPGSSRMHAIIETSPESVVVIDMGSSSGTRVNGEKVSKAELRHGDRIEIGATTLVVGFE